MNHNYNRASLPSEIENQMKLWRMQLVGMPRAYIEFHQKLAEESLADQPDIIIIHRTYMADDGWFDGMKFLHVVAETKRGELFKAKWTDGQRWMKASPSGGWSYME